MSPAHAIGQRESLSWLARAHARAETERARRAGQVLDEAELAARMTHRLTRFGCHPDQIAWRCHELADCAHTRWDEMEIYRLSESPEGAGTDERTRLFSLRVERVLSRLYAAESGGPDDLVHVTCTGYASPSAAQRLVAEKGWGEHTRVTHAYHMGCYAAFPALRLAAALAVAEQRSAPRVDVVHTEMCSLHLNPLRHEAEQLVVQSLFADGFTRYSVGRPGAYDGRSPALTLLAQKEALVPDSADCMTWIVAEHGMRMTLAREVPDRLARTVRPFVAALCAGAGIDDAARARAMYAIHPGGPRILDVVRDALEIDEARIASSRCVLRSRGNMSSATIPHIWMTIAQSRDAERGVPIVSLAFGPGLTMCGAVLRKGPP